MKHKTKSKRHCESDSSSDSDAPLVELRRSSSKSSLFKYSEEKCEFCDKSFNNKYNMLVHNATHIIIPLINQKLHKCSQCIQHFNSIESLAWHAMKSHPYISDNKDYLPKLLQSFIQRQPVTVLTKEPFLSKGSNKFNGETDAQVRMNGEQDNVPEILQSLVKKEPVTILTKLEDPIITENEKILQSLVKNEPVTLLKKESFEIENDESENDCITVFDSDDDENIEINDIDIKSEIEFEHVNIDGYREERNPKIKDRIKFEDEDDEIIELNDLITPTSIQNPPSNLRRNAIIIGNKPNVRESIEKDNVQYKSIHNDELKKPGMFRCKKCSIMFPNRYEAIIHETTHLKRKRSHPFLCIYCDWYVGCSPSSLVLHKKLKHPDKPYHHAKSKFSKCSDCGLSYHNRYRHRKNYHNEYECKHCDAIFTSINEWTQHKLVHSRQEVAVSSEAVSSVQETWLIKTVKVCEFCYHWFKERSNLKYQHVKHYFKLGERLPCERCDKLFFELRIVRMRWRKGKQNPLKRSETTEVKKPKKSLSNSDRLKNVQMRLQKMKWLNKF
ncbi:hypothetical protein ABMA27_012580 [Loxostege sticticalis]|uniref:C2H2-type domain-containing protein n=1 Tax=Loxostege sticticalis TaxID=481309 RepID=A0ABR3GZ44_LOXSC